MPAIILVALSCTKRHVSLSASSSSRLERPNPLTTSTPNVQVIHECLAYVDLVLRGIECKEGTKLGTVHG